MRSPVIITPNPSTVSEYWQEMKAHAGLIALFAGQELRTLYAQTYLGILWAIIRPVFTLAVFTIIFRLFLKVPTQSPYYLFAFAGMIAWNLFSQITITASTAIIQRQGLIRKMKFPKLVLPLSKILIALPETGISLAILFALLVFEKVHIGFNLFLLPVFILLTIASAFAIAVWMNVLNIRFRDLNQILPTIVGIAVWITPVFYPTTVIPPRYDFFVYLNPMAGIIKGYRYAILGEAFPEQAYWWAIIFMLFVMLAGIWFFIRAEDKMVDYA